MTAPLPQPRPRSGARVWLALALPPLAWVVFEWGLGSALRPACETVGRWLGPAWGAASLAACLVAALLVRPISDDPAAVPVRDWLARLALMLSGIFALAIALQTLATLIVPSCLR